MKPLPADTPSPQLSTEQVIQIMLRGVEEAGGQNKYARTLGISPQHLSDILRGNRGLGEKVLRSLGLEPVLHYRRRR